MSRLVSRKNIQRTPESARITMSSKIYYVQRHDFQDTEDEIGRVHFQSAHATLELANEEAKQLLHYILEEEDYDQRGELQGEGIQPSGMYKGEVRLFQDYTEDSVDTCVVTVEEAVLHGGIVQVVREEQSRKRQRTENIGSEGGEPAESGAEEISGGEGGEGTEQNPVRVQ